MRHLFLLAGLFFMQTIPAPQPTREVWQPTNWTTVDYTLAYTTVPNSLMIFRNGLALAYGIDYTVAASPATGTSQVNFANNVADLPEPGDVWVFNYQH